jgi:hypothetical protein
MRRLLLIVALSSALAGCGRTYEDSLRSQATEEPNLKPRTGSASEKLVAIEAKSLDGVLHGRFVLQGAKPDKRKVVPADKPECLKAAGEPKFADDIYNLDWQIGSGGGVKNVVVFIRTPEGKFFPVKEEDQKVGGEQVIDQPFCAFHPQVVVHYPAYINKDGARETTGQKLTIYNTGEILHNADLQNADPRSGNSGFNVNIPPKTTKEVKLNQQPSELNLRCSIHPWMKAQIWVFHHPYATKTDESGEFTISNLPTGVDVKLCFWHPALGFFGEGGEAGKTYRFEPGKKSLGDIPVTPR